MKQTHDPHTAPTQAPDLDPREAPLAALLAGTNDDGELLGHVREAAPAARARMLMASRSAASGRALASAAPLRGWAVAAGLLIAIGMGGFFLLHGAGAVGSQAQQVAFEPVNAGLAPRQDVVLQEDAALSLFHDIETFDALGVGSDDLLALGE